MVYALKKIVGCKYLYLYAADLSADSTLVAYYKAKLGFKGLDREKIKPLIPYYDKGLASFIKMHFSFVLSSSVNGSTNALHLSEK